MVDATTVAAVRELDAEALREERRKVARDLRESTRKLERIDEKYRNTLRAGAAAKKEGNEDRLHRLKQRARKLKRNYKHEKTACHDDVERLVVLETVRAARQECDASGEELAASVRDMSDAEFQAFRDEVRRQVRLEVDTLGSDVDDHVPHDLILTVVNETLAELRPGFEPDPDGFPLGAGKPVRLDQPDVDDLPEEPAVTGDLDGSGGLDDLEDIDLDSVDVPVEDSPELDGG